MSLSNTVEHEMCQDFLTRHPVIYLALSTTDPGEDGTDASEPSTNYGYIRQPVEVVVSGSFIACTTVVIFPVATGDWGSIAYVALFDAETGGNFLGSGSVATTPCPANTIIMIPQDTAIISMN